MKSERRPRRESTGRPTVYDVAELAGVSTATVSFSFSRPERVREETRRAVLEAADALGYVPSAAARGLARGKTGAIGLYAFDYLLDPAEEPATEERLVERALARSDARLFPLYSDEVQRGVQLECRRNGYALMLGAGHAAHAPGVIDVAGRVDGLITFAGAAPHDVLVQLASRIPIVELGGSGRRPGIRTVLVDQRTAMAELVSHLVTTHGHRRFAYFGELDIPEFAARYAGVGDVLTAAGLPVPAAVTSHPGDDESTVRAVRQVLAGELPDAIVCSTDQEALVAIRVLAEAGMRVPHDIAVTGFDGVIAGRLSSPVLTTVRQPMEAVGRVAVRVLLDVLRGDGAGGRAADADAVLPSRLWLGVSCGCSVDDAQS
ncbi:LacI family DNA-binding transcriptional regulator [Microbacterium radiodurans]|uniref:LacI family transcriptional regulator n=1 Tax=Microbacterium radiodurans TaxID=661398 RepID=A0A5J5IYS9_9MICO|nr:LacI family DNA-binding transcriptional regulator [Microbacterium radiodurans]KAA9089680.1 LacI family transcriptional regulator [Microbacterium radiodurans]